MKPTLLRLALLCVLLALPHVGIHAASGAEESAIQEEAQIIRGLYQDGAYSTAAKAAEQFLQNHPNSLARAEVLFVLADIKKKNDTPDYALRLYDELIFKHIDSPLREEALYASAQIYHQQENYFKSRQQYDRLLFAYPDSRHKTKALYFRAEADFKGKNWTAFFLSYEESMLEQEALPSVARANLLSMRLWSLKATGEEKKAKAELEAILKDDSLPEENKAEFLYHQSRLLEKEGKKQEAIAGYTRIAEGYPGTHAEELSLFARAEMIYKDALNKTADELQMLEGIAIYHALITREPPYRRSDSLYRKAWLSYYAGVHESAIGQFEELITEPQFQGDFSLYSALHAMLLEQNRSEEAADLAEQIQQQGFTPEQKYSIRLKQLSHISRRGQCDSISVETPAQPANTSGDASNAASVDTPTGNAPQGKQQEELLSLRAECYFVAKKYKEAAADYAQIPQDSEYAGLTFIHYTQSLLRLKRYEDAVKLTKDTEGKPGYPALTQTLPLRIEALHRVRRYPKTLATELRRLFALSPKTQQDYRYHLIAVEAYKRLKNTAKVEKHYNQALEFLPKKNNKERLGILDELAGYHEKQGKYKKVAQTYEKALPHMNATQRNQVILYLANVWQTRLKSPKTAIAYYKRLHRKGKTKAHLQATSQLADLYIAKKQYKTAASTLAPVAKNISAQSPHYLSMNYRLGQLYQILEQWKRSLEYYDLVAKTSKNTPEKQDAQKQAAAIRKYLAQ